MHAHAASREVSPIYERDPHNAPNMMRGRKMSTGGNRSWSEEEEAFLLRTRSQKMPYKHIAAQLKKTELACRLHYHQLSHGSHRRKRSTSVSSNLSTCSRGTTPTHYGNYDEHEYAIPESARGMSPISSINTSPRSRANSMSMPNANLIRAQKPLLPKPVHHSGMPLSATEESPLAAFRIHHSSRSSVSGPPMPHHMPIDTDRLRAIYEAHRTKFWDQIAYEYGPGVSAAQLEHVWREVGNATAALPPFAHGASKPPTPGASPDGARARHIELPRLSTGAHYNHPPLVPHSGVASGPGGPTQYQLPQYNPRTMSAVEPGPPRPMSALSGPTSASDYNRPVYQLPAVTERSPMTSSMERRGSESMTRTASGQSNGVPATKIAALLTEDRHPRPRTESPKTAHPDHHDMPLRRD